MEEAIGGYLTGVLTVKYLRPTPVKKVTLRTKIVEKGEKKVKVSCDLFSDNQLCVTGGIIAVRLG